MFPNEDGEGEVVDTPTETVETPAEPVETPAEPAAWDGDFGKLAEQPWWASVPEDARPHILKAHEERTSLSSRGEYLERLFASDDTVAAVRAELEQERGKLASLQEALSKAEGTAKEHEERASALESRIAEQEADRAFEATKAKYPDIFADVVLTEDKSAVDETKGAYPRFVRLLASGMSEEDAAVAARAFLSKPAGPPPKVMTRPVELPKSVVAAKSGGGTASDTVTLADRNESFDARYKRLEREIKEDAEAAARRG